MKILTILGTRPEIIRLSLIIPLLDKYSDHKVFHTGQNESPELKDIFYDELNLRHPDEYLGRHGLSAIEHVGAMFERTEKILHSFKPDRILILGDTNSGLTAYVAKRQGIKVYHMEAGNRCYDDRVPEEVNRRIIDHSSDILLPYTEGSRRNLLQEGIASHKIYVTGNPIYEILQQHEKRIEESQILNLLKKKKQEYFLVTLHREENVDKPERLEKFLRELSQLYTKWGYPVLVSLHPRTRQKLENKKIPEGIELHQPWGLFDFIHLEKHAFCVLTDSGTVQEECCIFKVPNVTLRDVTERPETIDCGSNILSGAEDIVSRVAIARDLPSDSVPPEYVMPHVSHTVTKIILGYRYH